MAQEAEFFSFFPKDSHSMISIERVTAKKAHNSAPLIQSILLAAYEQRFEREIPLLSPGAVRQHLFDPKDPDFVAAQEQLISEGLDNGVTYWKASQTDASEDIIGVAKTSPSRPRSLNPIRWFDPPNCFLNDIDVLPRVAGQSVGSALMYVALSDFEDDRRVVLHAFYKNKPTNDWFERLGFVASAVAIADFEVGEERIPQIQYEALAISGVKAELVRQRPWLAQALTD
jgi:ribosomal protein S18 acetylase RimI-like enzyme